MTESLVRPLIKLPNGSSSGRRVLIVQRRLPHYRVSFFNALKKELLDRGVVLDLAYGEPNPEERSKNDSGTLQWAHRLKTFYYLGNRLCWQPFGHLLSESSLVVATSENKLLYNLAVQFSGQPRRFALWGHGANFQGDSSSLRERFKKLIAKYADWWFTYTEVSVPFVQASGFPRERITVLNNSIDTSELAVQRSAVTSFDQSDFKTAFRLQGSRIGIFVGSMFAEKRIDFLLSAIKQVRARVPDFEFLFVGSGPLKSQVQTFCDTHPWAHYLGVRTGPEKATAISVATVMLNPGLVGLGILDSFVFGVPMITTDCRLHSPEIAYLASGENGLMTRDEIGAYVDAVIRLLNEPDVRQRMSAACEASAQKYSVEEMARRFADGVIHCLDAPMLRRHFPQ